MCYNSYNIMSDFFSGIYGSVRDPDVIMNQGPLPPTSTAGIPSGYPDAQINDRSNLVGSMSAYVGPKGGNMGSDASYQNIPHVAQRIIPQISLPEPQNYKEVCFFVFSFVTRKLFILIIFII
jgi:hypothetical protein